PGGEHSSLGVLTMHAVCHIAHQRLGNYADAAAWLAFTRNMATCYGSSFASVMETTGFVPNVVPATVQPFSGMTPTRETSLDVASLTNNGLYNTMIDQNNYMNCSHQIEHSI